MQTPKGLINLGNTCYLNSAIQLLRYSKYIRKYLLDNQDLGPYTNAGAQLVNQTQGPTKFRELMSEVNYSFGDGSQQDSHELISMYFNCLDEEQTDEKEKLSKYMNYNITQTCQCEICQTTFEKTIIDSQMILDIGFLDETQHLTDDVQPQYQQGTLYQCIDKLFEDNILELFCEKCQNRTKHTIKQKLTSLPYQLLIVFKRFDQFNKKRRNVIQYYETLDLNKYLDASNKKAQYRIDAVSLHSGDTMSGHYTAYVNTGDKQYLCDDGFIREFPINYNTQQAYILSYSIITDDQ